jgi:hypothetical protein
MELSVSQQASPARPRAFRRLRRDQRGVALLEFAIVAPIFFFILYALVVFGMALALKQSVTNAAAEGARATIGVKDDPLTTGVDERIVFAENVVKQRLSWLSASQLSYVDFTGTQIVTNCGATSGTCIRVKVSYPYKDHSLVPLAPIVGGLTPQTVGSTAEVQIS